MCVIVGKCGGLWGGREIFPILGCGQFGVYGLRGVQIFTNFDIFKKFLILTFFHHPHFVLKNINNYQNVTKSHPFPYTLQNFRMWTCDTLPQNPTVYLTKCQNNRYSFE